MSFGRALARLLTSNAARPMTRNTTPRHSTRVASRTAWSHDTPEIAVSTSIRLGTRPIWYTVPGRAKSSTPIPWAASGAPRSCGGPPSRVSRPRDRDAQRHPERRSHGRRHRPRERGRRLLRRRRRLRRMREAGRRSRRSAPAHRPSCVRITRPGISPRRYEGIANPALAQASRVIRQTIAIRSAAAPWRTIAATPASARVVIAPGQWARSRARAARASSMTDERIISRVLPPMRRREDPLVAADPSPAVDAVREPNRAATPNPRPPHGRLPLVPQAWLPVLASMNDRKTRRGSDDGWRLVARTHPR